MASPPESYETKINPSDSGDQIAISTPHVGQTFHFPQLIYKSDRHISMAQADEP